MTEPSGSSRKKKKTYTERRVCDELGINQLELYLVSSKFKLGTFDSLTHLLTFTEKEVDEIAARLGIVRRRRAELTDAQRNSAPEPTGE